MFFIITVPGMLKNITKGKFILLMPEPVFMLRYDDIPKRIRVTGTVNVSRIRNSRGLKFIDEIPAAIGKRMARNDMKETCISTALALTFSRCLTFLTIIGMFMDENRAGMRK